MVAPDVDMRKLRYFVAVAEELNFGRAAERLHIAQPVLSRQIRSFESELGVQLFARNSRGTQLTAAGKQLLEDARFLLAESKALQQRLSRVADPTVTVTVGVMPGLMATAAAAAFEADDPSRRAVVVQLGWAEQVDVVHRGVGCGDRQPGPRRIRQRGAGVPEADDLTFGCRSLAAISASTATTTPNAKYSAGSHGATPNSASESSA
jgi:DNA-binding transcriptional LysR family regulator